jgi:hypothetical protein
MFIRVSSILMICVMVIFSYMACHAQDIDAAIGDSIALGTGHALGVPTYAWTNAGSCAILAKTPALRYRNVVVSAGINDPPGECVGLILMALHHARRVVVILPAWINSARANVLRIATHLHMYTISYQCRGPCTIQNFHPASYVDLAADVQAIWDAP